MKALIDRRVDAMMAAGLLEEVRSLLEQYLRQGEDFLKNTQVWVCTICGFVYVGDTPPELCPVCKVPAWKFEKVEGRKAS